MVFRPILGKTPLLFNFNSIFFVMLMTLHYSGQKHRPQAYGDGLAVLLNYAGQCGVLSLFQSLKKCNHYFIFEWYSHLPEDSIKRLLALFLTLL